MNTCVSTIILCFTDCFNQFKSEMTSDYQNKNDSEDFVELEPLNVNSNYNKIIWDKSFEPDTTKSIEFLTEVKKTSPKNQIKIITNYVGTDKLESAYFRKVDIKNFNPNPITNPNDFIIDISPINKWDKEFIFIEKNE